MGAGHILGSGPGGGRVAAQYLAPTGPETHQRPVRRPPRWPQPHLPAGGALRGQPGACARPPAPSGAPPASHPDTPACLPLLGPFPHAHSTSSLASAPPGSPGLERWARPGSVALSPCRGLAAPPLSVTSRSALLWFLCCLDCEPWPLPFTLCPALAGQPRERDVIRSSRLVSEWLCVLAEAARGLPKTGSPAHLGLVACLDPPVPGAWAGRWLCIQLPTVLPVAGTHRGCRRLPGGPCPSTTALRPRLPGYCLLPPLPSFPQPGPGSWTSKAPAGSGLWATGPPFPSWGGGHRDMGRALPTGEDPRSVLFPPLPWRS